MECGPTTVNSDTLPTKHKDLHVVHDHDRNITEWDTNPYSELRPRNPAVLAEEKPECPEKKLPHMPINEYNKAIINILTTQYTV